MSKRLFPVTVSFLFLNISRAKRFCSVFVTALTLAGVFYTPAEALTPAYAQTVQQSGKTVRILPSQEVESTFPSSVYFRGKTAPVQQRNASAARFADDSLVFAGLVDSGGYASSVRETYQMYLLCDKPMRIGDRPLPAGAYGAGFVDDRFIVMDIGGHTVAEGQTHMDDQITRPRPLQLLQPAGSNVRLYLGRRWVLLDEQPQAQ